MGKRIIASILFFGGLLILLGVTGTSDYESLHSSIPFMPFWQYILLGLCGLGLIFLGIIILIQPSQIKGGDLQWQNRKQKRQC